MKANAVFPGKPSSVHLAELAKPLVTDPDQLCVNTIRTLSMDAVQQANSGHPGTPWPWHR